MRIGILVFPGVQQLDLTGPYEVFASLPGAEVLLVWKERATVRASTGLVFEPTATFAACPQLDVICVPGGAGVNALLEDAAVLAFVRGQAAGARYVTSVCTGALVLGAAGLLRGVRATTHWAAHDLLTGYGAVPVRARVVRDGRMVSGGGVTAGIDFALTLAAEIADEATAQGIQLMLEYAPAPPFEAGDPETAPAGVVAAVRARGAGMRAERERLVRGWGGRGRTTKMVTCEARVDGGWVPLGIEDALGRRGEVAMRCPECHGPVRAHKAGTTGQAAHFEHRQGHAGCSFSGAWDGRGRTVHPLAVG